MNISTPSIIENLLETYATEPMDYNTRAKHEVLYILGLHRPEEYMTQRKLARMAEAYHTDDMATYSDLVDQLTTALANRNAISLKA